MIRINDNDYVLCVWNVGKWDVDIMSVTLRHDGDPWFKTVIRFGYGEGDATTLYDDKRWIEVKLEGKTEKAAGRIAHELFRKTRRRGDDSAFRFVRGGPDAFMHALTSMPLTIKSNPARP